MARTLSFTQVNMLLRCPAQYEFRYVRGLKIPPAGALIQGGAYHEALATNFLYKLRSQTDMEIADVLDAFSTAWMNQLRKHQTTKGEGFEQIKWDANPGTLKDQAISMLQVYHQRVAPMIMPEQVEQELEVPISKDLKYKGIIDLVDTSKVIIDHKLTSRRMSQLDADKNIQVTGYHYLREAKGYKYRSAFHNAVKTTGKIFILETTRTKQDIEWWLSLVKKVARQIETGIFPPNPTGFLCSAQYCGYYKLCRGRQ